MRPIELQPDSNLLTAVDAAVILAVSAAICLAARNLSFMSALVPLLILARLAAVAALAERERVNMRAELLFLLACVALGAFNDWNSVHNRRIYWYAVPHDFAWSSIPLWMLLYWGMILRFLARLTRWGALGPPARPSNRVGRGRLARDSAALKIGIELLIVFATRRAIYRFYLDPLLSWLPFAAGLALILLLFQTTRHDLKLILIFGVGGPLIEILYIRVGGLHGYHLGWLGGVPLWLALWWLLAVLVWKDLTLRVTPWLQR